MDNVRIWPAVTWRLQGSPVTFSSSMRRNGPSKKKRAFKVGSWIRAVGVLNSFAVEGPPLASRKSKVEMLQAGMPESAGISTTLTSQATWVLLARPWDEKRVLTVHSPPACLNRRRMDPVPCESGVVASSVQEKS